MYVRYDLLTGVKVMIINASVGRYHLMGLCPILDCLTQIDMAVRVGKFNFFI